MMGPSPSFTFPAMPPLVWELDRSSTHTWPVTTQPVMVPYVTPAMPPTFCWPRISQSIMATFFT